MDFCSVLIRKFGSLSVIATNIYYCLRRTFRKGNVGLIQGVMIYNAHSFDYWIVMMLLFVKITEQFIAGLKRLVASNK